MLEVKKTTGERVAGMQSGCAFLNTEGGWLFFGIHPTTCADSEALQRDFGFTPKITLREGLRRFAEWYAAYYQKKL